MPKEGARKAPVAIIYVSARFFRCPRGGATKCKAAGGRPHGCRREAAGRPLGGREGTMTPWLALPTKYTSLLRNTNEVHRIYHAVGPEARRICGWCLSSHPSHTVAYFLEDPHPVRYALSGGFAGHGGALHPIASLNPVWLFPKFGPSQKGFLSRS